MASNRPRDGKKSSRNELEPFIVRVNQRFIALSLLSCILLAFAVGRTAKVLLILIPQQERLQQAVEKANLLQQQQHHDHTHNIKLPTPILKEGKTIPHTTYSSKNFDTAGSATINSRWVVTEQGQPGNFQATVDPDATPAEESSSEDEEQHFPEGEHLLLDIANVDSGFLNSEEQLAHAMLQLIDECGLTLLSYHCHSMTPIGVSCAGVLLESHVSFHTWPEEGVITLDLFTCGEAKLLPVVPVVEKLFAIPSKSKTDEKPYMIWAHKYRGFRELTEDDISELIDFDRFPIGSMTDFKQQVVTVHTDFQRVDVVDVVRPHSQSLELYEKSLSNDGSYESLHPEFFEPDRIIYLDGVLQSCRSGDAAYHESLVHPAMFAHENPKRVAIIGGGEGATLREVLKHKTVEKLVMVEIDEKMVNVSRKHIPGWSDCSNLIGSKADCFEDDRVELHCEDAFQWFIDRFLNGTRTDEQPFDVIIMDALDPQIQKIFVEALYNGGPFLGSLPNALSENGVFIGQVGEAPHLSDPREDLSLNRNRVNFIKTLIDLGFESIVDYDERDHSFFGNPWQYIVAFKSFDSRANWFVTEAETNLKIRKRSMLTKDGSSPFLYFDGATKLSYMLPAKGSETVFCRSHLSSPICSQQHGFDPEFPNLLLSDTLEVNASALGERAGRGVFAKRDIPVQSYLGLDTLVHTVYMAPSTYSLISDMGSHKIASSSLEKYIYEYGHTFSRHGKIDIMVDTSLQCFINHGCKGSNNVGHNIGVTEESANPEAIDPELLYRYFGEERIYNPFAERQTHFFSSGTPTRDIKEGEELFDNYLGMSGIDAKTWKEGVLGLKDTCSIGV